MFNPMIVESGSFAAAAVAESAEKSGNYIIDLYNKLHVPVEKPLPYESFHLISIGIVLVVTVLLAFLLRNAKPAVIRGVLIFFWLVMVLFELFAQFVRSSTLVDGILVFDYRWYSFPFQLCATGLYILPFIILMPECRTRDAMMIYMGLYSFFGGLLVCTIPTTVFTKHLISNVHTMAQHGSQIVVGVLMLVYNRKKLKLTNFALATVVFLILAFMAIGLNELMHNVLLAYGEDPEGFNMFYITPYYNSNMPVLGYVFDRVPWGVFVTLYLVGFIMISLLIYSIAKLPMFIKERIRASRDKKNSPVVAADDIAEAAAAH